MIFALCGKSSSGKDTIKKKLMERGIPLDIVVSHTTRPMRKGEVQGKDYHFVSKEEYLFMLSNGRILEERKYNTVKGEWIYFTSKDSIDIERDYLVVASLAQIKSYKNVYGGKVKPIYIDIDDDSLLSRSIEREKSVGRGNFDEICRRFLADMKDFSEEKRTEVGICSECTFSNYDIDECVSKVYAYILSLIYN